MSDYDDDFDVILRGDKFEAIEEFEILSSPYPGSPGRGEVKQQVRVQEGDRFVFNGEIVKEYGDRRTVLCDFLYIPYESGTGIAEMRVVVKDPMFILSRVVRI